MRRYVKIITICLVTLISVMWTSCMATETNLISGENVNYVDSYEEYENLINEATNQYSQDDLAGMYEDYREYMREYYKVYEREKTVRAKVVKTEEVKAEYEVDEYYYSTMKYEFQPIIVEIMEGEHSGKKFEMDYLLTGDSLNNIKYSELKVGDKIFVSIYTDEETGELYADITNTGSNVERFGTVFCIGIIAIVLLIIYGGKKGLIASLITLLILDFCLVIIPNMGFTGHGFVIGGIILILLLIFTYTISKLGLNKNATKASIVSIILNAITVMLLITFNYLTRTVGVTFEVAALSENVIMGNMNFESLYIIITMIIASLAITDVVCKCMKKLENTQVTAFNEKLEVCKDTLGANVLLVVISLIALYIQNHLLLLTNKYTDVEILNAEILVVELIRVFTIIIAMALAVPTVVAFDERRDEHIESQKKDNVIKNVKTENKNEKEVEIKELEYNEKYRPLSAWKYIGYSLLFMIPVMGLISAIILAFNNKNIHRRSFARSFIGITIICLILGFLLPLIGTLLWNAAEQGYMVK